MVYLSFVYHNLTSSIILNVSYFANPHFLYYLLVLAGFDIDCTLLLFNW